MGGALDPAGFQALRCTPAFTTHLADKNTENQWNPKYGCKDTVTTCFALIALVAWKYWFDSTLRKLSVRLILY